MRINQFVARASGLSRRAADQAIAAGRVTINNRKSQLGDQVDSNDAVLLDNQPIRLPAHFTTIMMNKPAGYVCSRRGQGSQTIYDLLPAKLHSLKPIGRLDKDSSGLLLLTNDGLLAHELTHPKYAKTKIYEATLDKILAFDHQQQIANGVRLDDGISRLTLHPLGQNKLKWQVSLSEGRNRQIRRTFAALGYNVTQLHRTHFGPYNLDNLPSGHVKNLPAK